MQIKLTAKLDRPGGATILCGSCKADTWAVVDRKGDRVVLAHGYRLGEGAVWRLSRHAEKKLQTEGYPGLRRPIVRGLKSKKREEEIRPCTQNLPSLIACPWCGRIQWLRPEALGLPVPADAAERQKNRAEILLLTRQKTVLG